MNRFRSAIVISQIVAYFYFMELWYFFWAVSLREKDTIGHEDTIQGPLGKIDLMN